MLKSAGNGVESSSKKGEVRAKEMKWCKMEEMRGLIRKEEMGLVQGCPLSTFVLATYMMTTTCPPCRAQDRETDTGLDLGARGLAQGLCASWKGGEIQVLGTRVLCQCCCAKTLNPNPNDYGARVTFKLCCGSCRSQDLLKRFQTVINTLQTHQGHSPNIYSTKAKRKGWAHSVQRGYQSKRGLGPVNTYHTMLES